MTGTAVLPNQQVYNEGIAHAADLRKMDKTIEKELIDVRSAMERDRIKNEQFYGKLKEISKIISANPDILKYIYIDKMAGNVNVILSSDNSGVPAHAGEGNRSRRREKPGRLTISGNRRPVFSEITHHSG